MTPPEPQPPTDSARKAPRATRWIAAGLLVVLAVVAYWQATQSEGYRDRQLVAMPMSELQRQASARGADLLTKYHLARRLLEDEGVEAGSQAVNSMLADVGDKTPKPLAARVYALAAYSASSTGDTAQAANWVRRAEEIGLADEYLFLARATGNLSADLLPEAVKELHQAIQLRPELAEPWSLLGQAHMRGGEPDLAKEAYQQAIRLKPNDPISHAELALVLTAAGSHAEAIPEYVAAVKNGGGDPQFDAFRAVGLCMAASSSQEYDEAKRSADSALAANPANEQVRSALWAMFMRLGRYRDLRNDLESILKLNPHHPTARLELATLLERMGEGARSKAVYAQFIAQADLAQDETTLKQRALLTKTDPKVFISLARILNKRGKATEAVRAYDYAVRLAPNDAKLRAEVEAFGKAIAK